MSMFIEVNSVDKKCPVIINLDHVIEIAPRLNGTCEIKMSDDGVSKSVMTVNNSYDEFKQFAMQTVSSADIANRIASIKKAAGIVEDEKPETEQPKAKKSTKAKIDLDIPKFGE